MSRNSPHYITLSDAPDIPKLKFRLFQDESDYPPMVSLFENSKIVDGTEIALTAQEIANWFNHSQTFDPFTDVLFIEIDGEPVGVSVAFWEEDPNDNYYYEHITVLLPEWRGYGLRHLMVRFSEDRLRDMAGSHPEQKSKKFWVFCEETETHLRSVLEDEGYQIFRYGFKLVRSTLENIPDLQLPQGIETRPVTPDQYSAIISAWNEACKELRGTIPFTDEGFAEWQEDPTFDPSLWQIAWHNDTVVGTTFCFINEYENAQYNRKRGYTELISVAKPWRGQGIAKALMVQGMKALKERGMTEAALGVDAGNPSGALGLYEAMGYKITKRVMYYWKPLD
ncbi:MAG: GNAT family N-acetyltransferase [Theionarchaea archaeon]|nr:GNAT family N-acetyltransferase [Theionarchaea archaeon]